MQNNNVTLTVIINGQSGNFDAREYVSPQDRQTYIEGREGSNFSLRIYNGNSFRVLAIPSVDGLSVLDGEPAGENSPGYLLEPRQTLDVPGWMVDEKTAAKFFFAGTKDGKDASYVAQMEKDTSNKGVIGLMVFREKPAAYFGNAAFAASGSLLRSAAPTGGTMRGIPTSGVAFNSLSLDSMSIATASCAAEPTLGTGFGDATDFATKKAEFERGDLLAILALYYADARGGKRKGIDVNVHVTKSPNPFPANKVGCATPKDWRR